MTRDERDQLRELRDATTDQDDKHLLRKAIAHIFNLEHKMQAIRTFTKAIENEIKTKEEQA